MVVGQVRPEHRHEMDLLSLLQSIITISQQKGRRARGDSTLGFCVCVCRRGHCGASAAAAAVHSGVCVLGCDGQRGAAEGALATAWQSRLFAEEVTITLGELKRTHTSTNTHACYI